MPEHDPAALQEWQRRLGKTGLARVIATLSAEAPRLIGQLHEGAARADAAALRRAAHSMKTPSGMFGAQDLARLCQELEDRAAAGILDDAASRADNVARRFETLARELAALSPAAVQHI